MSKAAMKKIALIGNPNSGKTTLFNLLTGSRQKVGNWPGVTVEKKTGLLALEGSQVEVIDLPGIYAFGDDFKALDEKIAQDFLASGEIDLLINVVDASNLERSLGLTQQLLELGLPVVVVVNMIDVARQSGMNIDIATLESRLGVCTIDMVAAHGSGVDRLLVALNEAHNLDDTSVTDSAPAQRDEATSADNDEALVKRFQRSRELINGVVVMQPEKSSLSDSLDAIVLNRWLGVPIFFLMIYLMFAFAVNLGAVFIDFFDILFATVFVDSTRWLLASIGAPGLLITLLAEGLGGGITLVATFIPVIGFLDLVFPEAGLVIDLKTTGRCPSVMSAEHQLQRAIYQKAKGNQAVKFLYVTPKKTNLLEDGDPNELLGRAKTQITRMERFLRSGTKRDIAGVIPVNPNTFYWNGAEAIREELYGI